MATDLEARYRALFETTLDGIMIVDDQGRYVDVNDSLCRMLKAPRERLVGAHFSEFTLPETLEAARGHFSRLKSEGSFEGEFPMRAADGSTVEMEWSSRADFVPGLHFCVARDISARKRAEAALRANEQRLRALMSHAPVGIFLTDPEGNCLFVNERWCEMAGLAPEEARGQGWVEALHPEDRERVFHEWYSAATAGREFASEYRFQTPRGKVTWLRGSAVAQRDEAGQVTEYIGTVTDITEHEQAEAALQVSELRVREQLAELDQLYRTAPVGLGFVDTRLRYVRINERLAAINGRPAAEHIGRTLREMVPDLADILEPVYRQVIETGKPVLDLEVHGSTPAAPEIERDWLVSYYPLAATDGTVRGVSSVIRDITERKRLEAALKERAAQLAESDRRKDEFLAVLAHELRNPLAPIRNAVELLSRLGPDEPRVNRAREIIARQVRHQSRLLDDLLDISRISRGRINLAPQTIDLIRLVRDTAEDSRSVLEGSGLSLQLRLPEGPVWVNGDPTRLSQVVGNLLQNAAKFTDPGGEVGVRCSVFGIRCSEGSDRIPNTEHRTPNAAIIVQDTGIGIEPGMLERVFDPFAQADRSLERTRGGLGLGLALVRGIIELHGGSVRAASDGAGRGATFTILLPVAPAPAAAESPGPLGPSSGPIRVLLIEDNRDAADTLRDLLELVGCTVEAAYSGPTGVAAARQFRPEVVLCDLGLPGMSGHQVAAELRRDPLLARARLIALSGYGQEEDQRRSREAGFDLHLTKPVEFAELQRLLELLPERGKV